jgi:hypothetical protein
LAAAEDQLSEHLTMLQAHESEESPHLNLYFFPE